MINERAAHVRHVLARVGHDPRFSGSIHDDASAGTYGFKGALVPGPILCSYMSHLFAEAWGERWLRHGTMTQQSRRPVYEGQALAAVATPIVRTASGLQVEVVLRNAEGEEVARATGGLPDGVAAAPDLAAFPHRPYRVPPPAIVPGGHRIGDPYGSAPVLYDEATHREYLDKAGETLALYRQEQLAHPGFMLNLSMRDAIASYVKPTPGVHVSVSAQHFNLARVGDTLTTSGGVVGTFEKKGHHYAESEQLVVANGTTPIALFRRTSIYALRSGPA